MTSSLIANEVKLVFKPNKSLQEQVTIKTSQDSFKYLLEVWDKDSLYYQEQFVVLYLDRMHRVIAHSCIAKGGLNYCHPDPKIVFAIALKCMASGLILVHNHPSCNKTPSESDKLLTKNFVQLAKLFDMSILDHIIICGERDYLSFADDHLLPNV